MGRVYVTGTGVTGTGCIIRNSSDPFIYVPASGSLLRKLEPISLRGFGLPVGREAISSIINAGSHASVF